MFEITCLDSNGNSIDKFTQWDMFQKINIVLTGYEYGYTFFRVHFSNKNMNESLVVEPTVSKSESGNDLTITADVPNEMLMEPYPVFVYLVVYYSDYGIEDIESSRRAIMQVEIPVRKKPKPSDYIYVKNTDTTTFEEIVVGIVRRLELKHSIDDDGKVTAWIGGV